MIHLLYKDNIKLYAKNEQDIDSLIHLTRVFSSDNGITHGLASADTSFSTEAKLNTLVELAYQRVR